MSAPELKGEVEGQGMGVTPSPASQGLGETQAGGQRFVKRVKITIEISEDEPLWVLYLRSWSLMRERKISLPEAFKKVLVDVLAELEELREELEECRETYYNLQIEYEGCINR